MLWMRSKTRNLNNNISIYKLLSNIGPETYNKKNLKKFKRLLPQHDITKKDEEGCNILHYLFSFQNGACSYESEEYRSECIKLVFKSIKNNDKDIQEVINRAVDNENNLCLHMLLDRMQKIPTPQERDDDKMFEHLYKIFERLLDNGADVTAQDAKGHNALYYLFSFKSTAHRNRCIMRVFDSIKSENKKGKHVDIIKDIINIVDNDRGTSLHMLLDRMQKIPNSTSIEKLKKAYNYEMFRYLLDNGADVNAQDTKNHNALHYLFSFENEEYRNECVQYMFDFIKSKNKGNELAAVRKIINTVCNKEKTCLHMLLEHMQDTDTKNPEDSPNYKMFRYLLNNGADVTVQDAKGHNALYYLFSFKNETYRNKCIELIFNSVNPGNREDKNEVIKGIIDEVDGSKETCLHMLLNHMKKTSHQDLKKDKHSNYEVFKSLLNHKADLSIKGPNEKSVFHYLSDFDDGETRNKLMQKIVDSKCNNTILDFDNNNSPIKSAIVQTIKSGSYKYIIESRSHEHIAKYIKNFEELGLTKNALTKHVLLPEQYRENATYHLILYKIEKTSKCELDLDKNLREYVEQAKQKRKDAHLPHKICKKVSQHAGNAKKAGSKIADYMKKLGPTSLLNNFLLVSAVIAAAVCCVLAGYFQIAAILFLSVVAYLSYDKIHNELFGGKSNEPKTSFTQVIAESYNKLFDQKLDDNRAGPAEAETDKFQQKIQNEKAISTHSR